MSRLQTSFVSGHEIFDYGLDELRQRVGLDPPFVLSFFRLFVRTVRRILFLDPPTQEGCRETWSTAFLSPADSIFLYTVRARRGVHDVYSRAMAEENCGRWTRLGGWGSELASWIGRVKEMKRSR